MVNEFIKLFQYDLNEYEEFPSKNEDYNAQVICEVELSVQILESINSLLECG